MALEAIVAVYADWGIGLKGTQPVVLKADRKHFREITGSDAVIVGRRTMEDFPGGKPLKGRHNIVVTRQALEIEGAEVVHMHTDQFQSADTSLPFSAFQPQLMILLRSVSLRESS